jgi:transmembrane sensor
MRPRHQRKAKKRIAKDAVRWVYTDPGKSESFARWLRQSPLHETVYLEVVELDRALGKINPRLLTPPADSSIGSTLQWKVGAGVAIAVGVTAFLSFWAWRSHDAASADIYRTQLGQIQHIDLSDGSSIDLNTETEVRVRYSGTLRFAQLVRGEALFKIRHSVARPFNVKANDTTVRDLGTAFSVRIRDSNAEEVLVTEGTAAVASAIQTETLKAGELATVRDDHIHSRTLIDVESQRRLAWTGGQLVFQGETLQEAINEFNRYNQRKLVLLDPHLAALKVGGTFRVTDPESFAMSLVPMHVPVHSIHDGTAQMILLGRGTASIR